jgi:carbamoyl-phosphate synthase small subunit
LKLYLEDGSVYGGNGFGASKTVAGEVVFNTGMSGYIETLTDPSYRGQILVLTYPLIGNYGVPGDREPGSIHRPFESSTIQVQGLVVQHYVDAYSHYRASRSLDQWLKDCDVPAVTGIDTRALTQKLREFGTMRGWLVNPGVELEEAKANAAMIDMRSDVFRLVAPDDIVRHDGGDVTILLIDIGAKDNIVRSMLDRGASVLRVPWHRRFEEFLGEVDGILIGNGPGDPKDLMELVGRIREVIEQYRGPMFGVCLGHQLLSLAVGADTYKLPYGHRSVNQPAKDLRTGRCYVTSQNHGFAVSDDTLPDGYEPWFANVNDQTNEGIRSTSRPIMSVQFHPEASPGPQDTGFLFDEFVDLARSKK